MTRKEVIHAINLEAMCQMGTTPEGRYIFYLTVTTIK